MNTYTALRHLLGSYLHQDFGLEFETAADAVRAFATSEPTSAVRAAADDIDLLLADAGFQASPSAVLLGLGCQYDPLSEGRTVAGWLRQVQQELRATGSSGEPFR